MYNSCRTNSTIFADISSCHSDSVCICAIWVSPLNYSRLTFFYHSSSNEYRSFFCSVKYFLCRCKSSAVPYAHSIREACSNPALTAACVIQPFSQKNVIRSMFFCPTSLGMIYNSCSLKCATYRSFASSVRLTG